MKYARTVFVVIGVVSVLVAMTPVASAEMIQIQLGGVDLVYDGTDIADANPSGSDPLTNATFLVNNVASGVDTTGVTLDLYLPIPTTNKIPILGGQVTSAIDGSMDLDLGGGEFLFLTLESSTVTYIPLASTIQFIFAGAVASIDDQNLPYSLSMANPVSVSFSTQIMGPVSEAGGFVTAFHSVGTGEITSIPEPATMSMLALGGLALLRKRRK